MDKTKQILQFLKNLITSNLYAVSLYSRKIAGAFSVFFIARYLSVYDYGLYSSYANLASYLLLIANLGYNEFILVSSNNEAKMVKIKQTFFIGMAVLITALYVIVSAFVPMEDHFVFALVMVKSFFDGTFFALVLPYFQASKKFKQIGIINILYSIVSIVIAVCALILKLSLVKYLIIYLVLGVINFVQCSFYIKINYFKFFKLFRNVGKIIDKRIIPYMTSSALLLTRISLPSLVVATLFPKETAALFFASNNIATIPSLFALAQLQQILPEMINKSKDEVIRVMKKSALVIFYINAVVVVFLLLFGKNLLLLIYNKEYYLNGYPVLVLLSVITLLNGVSGVLATYLTASGNQKFNQRCQVEGFIISVVSLAVLYRFGIYAILLFYFILMAYFLPRYLIFIRRYLKSL